MEIDWQSDSDKVSSGFLPVADEDKELHDVGWFRWWANIWQSYQWNASYGERNSPWILPKNKFPLSFYGQRLFIRIAPW